ncbi:MAG: general stress protein CsbD [Salinibacter sp.]
MATEKMNEDWRRIRDQIKDIWDETDFDDKQMKRARGDLEKIMGLIHDKTGESIEEIRRKMSAIL